MTMAKSGELRRSRERMAPRLTTQTRQIQLRRRGSLLLSMALGAVSTFAILASPAFATHDCPSSHRVIFSPDTNGRGVRVSGPGMRVSDTVVECARASTLSVVNSSETRFVEVGWYEEAVDVTPCPQTSGNPRILVAKGINGVFTCDPDVIGPDTITNAPTDDGFWVHDDNQDGNWDYYHNGSFLGFFGLGSFITGDPRAQGERKSTHDSMYALHDGLKRMNSSKSWVSWTGTTIIVDDDADYRGCVRSNTKVEVKLGTC